MNSTRRVIVLVARSLFLVIVTASALVLLAMAAPDSAGGSQAPPQHEREVKKQPWRIEPVKVIAVSTRNRGNLEIGSVFSDTDDWLNGLKLTVRNDSDKVVTAVVIGLDFLRESGDDGKKFEHDIYFGVSPITPQYLNRDPNKILRPGETAELEISARTYSSINNALQRLGYPNSIRSIVARIREVGFEDASVLLSGTLYIQDPNNPNDPTKKVRANPQPINRRHHSIGRLRVEESSTSSELNPKKESKAVSVPEGCWDQSYAPPVLCAIPGIVIIATCYHRVSELGNSGGNYDVESREVLCTIQGESCGDWLVEAPAYIQCSIPCGEYLPF